MRMRCSVQTKNIFRLLGRFRRRLPVRRPAGESLETCRATRDTRVVAGRFRRLPSPSGHGYQSRRAGTAMPLYAFATWEARYNPRAPSCHSEDRGRMNAERDKPNRLDSPGQAGELREARGSGASRGSEHETVDEGSSSPGSNSGASGPTVDSGGVGKKLRALRMEE